MNENEKNEQLNHSDDFLESDLDDFEETIPVSFEVPGFVEAHDSTEGLTEASPLFHGILTETDPNFGPALKDAVNRWDIQDSQCGSRYSYWGAVINRSDTTEWYLGGGRKRINGRYTTNPDTVPTSNHFDGFELDPTGRTQISGPVIVNSMSLPRYLRVKAYTAIASSFQVSMLPQGKKLRADMSLRYTMASAGMEGRLDLSLSINGRSNSRNCLIMGNENNSSSEVISHEKFPITASMTGGLLKTSYEFKVHHVSEPLRYFLRVSASCSQMFQLLEAKCDIYEL